jgi:hypothetical protein
LVTQLLLNNQGIKDTVSFRLGAKLIDYESRKNFDRNDLRSARLSIKRAESRVRK